MTRLADPRKVSRDDACAIFEGLARAQIKLWKLQAAFDDRVAALKSALKENSAQYSEALGTAAAELSDAILGHREWFDKARKIKTPFGAFGLETESNVEIDDEEALVQVLMARGYDNCLKITRSVLKTPLRARLDAGETFPGCRILTGDVAKYRVDRSLADEFEVTDAGRAATTQATTEYAGG